MGWAALVKNLLGLFAHVASFFRDRQLLQAGEARARAEFTAEQAERANRANRARINSRNTGVRDTDYRD